LHADFFIKFLLNPEVECSHFFRTSVYLERNTCHYILDFFIATAARTAGSKWPVKLVAVCTLLRTDESEVLGEFTVKKSREAPLKLLSLKHSQLFGH
jgi:hypothetical protein